MAQVDILDYNQQQSAGARMRESKTKNEEVKDEQQKISLRQKVASAKKALNIKEKAKKKIEEKVTAPAKMGTNWLLRWAWLSSGTVLGFIFIGLPYINIHVFLRFVLGEKFFCKLGDEWIPKKIKAVGGDAGKMTGKGIGLIEILILLFLDAVALFSILAILGLISMIISWLGGGFWRFLWETVKAIYNLGWDGVSALIDLFGDIETPLSK